MYVLTGLVERKLVLESCLQNGEWGVLEMYILLTDEILEFDEWALESVYEQAPLTFDIKLDILQHEHLFFSLLMARCPVSS